MSFAEFRQFAIEHALESLDDTFVSGAIGEPEEKIRGRFADAAVDRIPNYGAGEIIAYSERSFFGGLVNILHPYSVMRLAGRGEGERERFCHLALRAARLRRLGSGAGVYS
jgi:hypothetical protein